MGIIQQREKEAEAASIRARLETAVRIRTIRQTTNKGSVHEEVSGIPEWINAVNGPTATAEASCVTTFAAGDPSEMSNSNNGQSVALPRILQK